MNFFADESELFVEEMLYQMESAGGSVQSHSGRLPMNRNVKANRESEDWIVTFLQSVLLKKKKG